MFCHVRVIYLPFQCCRRRSVGGRNGSKQCTANASNVPMPVGIQYFLLFRSAILPVDRTRQWQSAVRARPAFFCTHGALPWLDRQFLTLRERKIMFLHLYIIYIKVTSKHARIRLLRCIQIATPSVPYFRSFTLSNKPRSNGQLHFYIYR
jgi:hypothetical protein